MDDLKLIIAKNIVELRKKINITQAELAERLNYSDKAVSKWERGESLPDILIFKQISEIFGVKVDYLFTEHSLKKDVSFFLPNILKNNRLVISLLSIGLIWLFATASFVVLSILDNGFFAWRAFIVAIPISAILALIFNAIWGKWKHMFIYLSILLWSILLTLYCSFITKNIWLIFIIGIPLQILIIIWSRFKKIH